MKKDTSLNLWIGRGMSGFVTLFLLLDSIVHMLRLAPVMTLFAQLGYPAHLVLGIGMLEFVCIVLYAVPRTAVLGAILVTGVLGGAVASHLRVGDPFLSHVLFPVYVGIVAWGGLFLRDSRVQALLPLRG